MKVENSIQARNSGTRRGARIAHSLGGTETGGAGPIARASSAGNKYRGRRERAAESLRSFDSSSD